MAKEKPKGVNDKVDSGDNGVADDAAQNTLALNPLVAIRPQDLVGGAAKAAKALATQPQLMMRYWGTMAAEMGKIAVGKSDLAAAPKDRRFADPAWATSPLHKGLLQAYLAWSKAVADTVERAELDDTDAARARLMSSIMVDTMSPSNNPLLNPAAVKELVNSGGGSAISGLINFFTDMADNGGLPSSVDSSKFRLGDNVATSPGQVVYRDEVIEVMQYAMPEGQVYERPLLIIPPQINKFYFTDLSPEKSMIKYLADNEIQPFCISWRNPTRDQASWGLDTYVNAVDSAVDAVRDICGSPTINVMGTCSGGITMTAYLAWQAALGLEKINQVVLAICVLDTESGLGGDLSALVTPETLEAAKDMSRQRGVLDGQELAKMFAWMRPNDLIWNYWVNNYLLGKQPPAFDVLFWNADTTRLPAELHADYLGLITSNPFVNANTLQIDGVPIDLSKVDLPTYVIAGTTDHITPWRKVYRSARLYGEDTTFVLSNSGHLQSMLNPPGNPKSWYQKGKVTTDDPDAWANATKRHEGSWWPDWIDMLHKTSGERRPAATAFGNDRHVPLAPAPGTYVFES